MKARIFSQVVNAGLRYVVPITISVGLTSIVSAQTGADFYTDPGTGIVYRRVAKTIERPVVETKIESREQTFYTPQTVTEVKPESRTVYTPVVENVWEPRMHGRWNPFQQPTIGYHHVPQTRWEARNEVVQRTQTRTHWIAEQRKVDVPQQIVRMQREDKVDYEPVGRIAPQPSPPGVSEAIAARLRPLASNEQIQPMASGYAAPSFSAPRIAGSSVGRMTSDPPQRNMSQSGRAAKELYPVGPSVHGQTLPPSTGGGVGVANLPTLPFFR